MVSSGSARSRIRVAASESVADAAHRKSRLDTGHINLALFSGGSRIVQLIIRVFSNELGLIGSALFRQQF